MTALGEQTYDPKSEEVTWSLNNLAWLYHNQGRYAEAELLYTRALAIWEKVLGPEDGDTQTAKRNYLACLEAQNKSQEDDTSEA